MVSFGESLSAGVAGGIVGGATVSIVIKAIDNYSAELKKAETSMGGMEKAALRVAPAITAIGVAYAGLAKSSIEAALKMEPLKASFAKLAENSDEFLETLQDVTKGTVSSIDLIASSNKALLLGLDQEALPSLFKNAAIVGRAAGRTTTEAIEDITIGIGRQSRLILDNLGIIVKAEVAYEEYAKSIGKTTEELTENERQTAFAAAAIESLEAKAKTLGGEIVDNTTTSIEQLKAQFMDMKIALGEELLPQLQLFLDTIGLIGPKTEEETKKAAGFLAFLGKVFLKTFTFISGMVIAIVETVGLFITGLIEFIATFIQGAVNLVIGGINAMIGAHDAIAKTGVGKKLGLSPIGKIEPIDITSNLKGSFERGAGSTQEAIENVFVNTFAGKTAPYVDMGAGEISRSIIINIENVNGMDPDEVARALNEELINRGV